MVPANPDLYLLNLSLDLALIAHKTGPGHKPTDCGDQVNRLDVDSGWTGLRSEVETKLRFFLELCEYIPDCQFMQLKGM